MSLCRWCVSIVTPWMEFILRTSKEYPISHYIYFVCVCVSLMQIAPFRHIFSQIHHAKLFRKIHVRNLDVWIICIKFFNVFFSSPYIRFDYSASHSSDATQAFKILKIIVALKSQCMFTKWCAGISKNNGNYKETHLLALCIGNSFISTDKYMQFQTIIQYKKWNIR